MPGTPPAKESPEPAQLEIKPTAGMAIRVMALIGSALLLALFLSFLLLGGGTDLFAQRATLTTYMPDATGLSTDSEVRLSGIRIGMVDKVEISGILDPQRAIRVKVHVWKRYLKNIPEDSQTDIDTDNIVGYAFIDINAGKSIVPIGEDGVLHSEPLKQAIDRADEIKVLQDNLTQIDKMLVQASDPASPVGKLIVGSAEYDSVNAGIGNFQRTIHSLVAPKSPLGQAFYSLDMYNKINDGVAGVDNALLSIQNGEGTAGNLFASDNRYNDMVRQLKDLRATLADLKAGKGQAGELLQNDDFYRRLEQMLASVNSMLASLNAGEGRAGALLANPQLYESLNGSLRQIQSMLRDLRENPRKYLRIKIF
jgi:phospholipid/cholesterol/gamma-HCH transport system substrate-binding protein